MESDPHQVSDDDLLIRRFKEGHEEAFDEMVLVHSAKLFRLAYGLLGNTQDAEEVVQDAFICAYKALPKFRGESSFETWMYRITVNLARNKFHWNRRRGSEQNVSLTVTDEANDSSGEQADLPDPRMGPDRLLENRELEQNVIGIIRNLPEKLREAMVLRHLEDMSYGEIAGMLKCKVGTVKSRLARGRDILRDELKKLNSGKRY